MDLRFIKGRTYNRRRDIHSVFGGNTQAGIITTNGGPIFLISASSGAQHGYSDLVRPDGVLEYTGQGRTGDQKFNRTNRSVLEHSENGKELLHFTQIKKGEIRFNGFYVYESHRIEKMPDGNNDIRDIIVFELRALDAVVDAVDHEPIQRDTADLAGLRDLAYASANMSPGQSKARSGGTVYERSRALRNYILARADGKCESCDQPAPFTTPNGAPFLEAHHIRRLSDGGPDDPRFVIGVCPNCHRHAHFGSDAEAKNKAMLKKVTSIET